MRSPIWLINEINKIIIKKYKFKFSKSFSNNNKLISKYATCPKPNLTQIRAAIRDKVKLPIKPAYVFFGLILVSLGPLKIFPNIYPPRSVKIQTTSTNKNWKKNFD